MKDRVFATPFEQLGPFRFNDDVAEVFPDMIRRSVPGYGQLVGGLGLLAKRHAQPNTHLIDLGTSLGASALSMARHVKTPGCRVVAVDNSQAMLDRARTLLAESGTESDLPIEWRLEDIRETPFSDLSVSCLNLTLQFIPIADRAPLLSRLCEATRPGGALLLAEKVCFDDADLQEWIQEAYWDFKRANGYSDLEVAQKRQAIENVLIPETSETHEARLRDAGFSRVWSWFQCLNFKGWIAIK